MAVWKHPKEFARRWLLPSELKSAIRDAGLTETFPGDGLLAFLDQSRLVRPVARINYPPEVYRWLWLQDRQLSAFGDPSLPVASEGRLLDQAIDLENRLHESGLGLLLPTDQPHPLDSLKQGDSPFVFFSAHCEDDAPLTGKGTLVGQSNGKPLYHNGFTRVFYQGWQLLRVAEALGCTQTTIFNPADREVWEFAVGATRDKPPQWNTNTYTSVALRGGAVLQRIEEFAPALEAAWFAGAYAGRAEWRRENRLRGESPEIIDSWPEDEWQAHVADRRAIAADASARYGVDTAGLIAAVTFFAEHWSDRRKTIPQALLDCYAQAIGHLIVLYRDLLPPDSYSWEKLAAEVGRVGGWFKPTLNVIFPNWLDQRRDQAIWQTKETIVPWFQGGAHGSFAFAEADCTRFVDWLVQCQMLEVFHNVERATTAAHDPLDEGLALLRMEVASLGRTFELLVSESGSVPVQGKTLNKKLQHLLATSCSIPHAWSLVDKAYQSLEPSAAGPQMPGPITDWHNRLQVALPKPLRTNAVGSGSAAPSNQPPERLIVAALAGGWFIRNCATHDRLAFARRRILTDLWERQFLAIAALWLALGKP